jgi:hypothetical protein
MQFENTCVPDIRWSLYLSTVTRLATAYDIPLRHIQLVTLKIIGWHQLTSVRMYSILKTIYMRFSTPVGTASLLFTLPFRN